MTSRKITIKCKECGKEVTKVILGSDGQYPEGMIRSKTNNLVDKCPNCNSRTLKIIKNKPIYK